MSRAAPELVIFDCDGVLVDSEPLSIDVLTHYFSELGAPIAHDLAYARFLGRSMATIIRIMHDEYGLHVTDRHLEELRERLNIRFRSELQPIPHIAAALAEIPYRRCVASSSKPERIRLSLGLTGLLESLEPHIYSATMVKNGKPAPDLFLHAARDMGASPADCVVVEDSPAGIQAAKSAGMRVLAFTGGTHAAPSGLHAAVEALSPDAVFDDMRRLPDLLLASPVANAS
jgi:HAD superfamily hydrolase (TIGR01509 family)